MKRFSLITRASIFAVFVFASCESTKVAVAPSSQKKEDSKEVASSVVSCARQATSDIAKADDDFIDAISTITITIISNPCTANKSVIKNKPFSSPYIVTVMDGGAPVSEFSLTAMYPIARSNDVLTYDTVCLKTDKDGTAYFTPNPSTISVNDTITFYPTPISSNGKVTQAAFDKSSSAPFVVKSDYLGSPGGILYVYDFNESGQPIRNNFALLRNLRNAGVNAGNAPISESGYLNKDAHSLYEVCKPIVHGEANFLIYGSFKYAGDNAVQIKQDGTEVTMIADITCISMADGSELYKTMIQQSASATDKKSATIKCKEELAAEIAEQVMYAM